MGKFFGIRSVSITGLMGNRQIILKVAPTMIKSMTGFGRTQLKYGRSKWTFEVRSLNHRFLEYSAKLPEVLLPFENEIRALVEARIARGKVYLFIGANGRAEDLERVVVDEKKVEFYYRSLRSIARRLRMDEKISLSDVLKLPDIFLVEKAEASMPQLWKFVRRGLERAIRELLSMREREGLVLKKDLAKHLAEIGNALSQIKKGASDAMTSYEQKLKERVKHLAEGVELDNEKLAREVALMADKADVSEEIVRLQSHLDLFASTLGAKESIGKKMDFIVQELNREANTIGAKSLCFGVTREVIRIKAAIEKIREQVQNIE